MTHEQIIVTACHYLLVDVLWIARQDASKHKQLLVNLFDDAWTKAYVDAAELCDD